MYSSHWGCRGETAGILCGYVFARLRLFSGGSSLCCVTDVVPFMCLLALAVTASPWQIPFVQIVRQTDRHAAGAWKTCRADRHRQGASLVRNNDPATRNQDSTCTGSGFKTNSCNKVTIMKVRTHWPAGTAVCPL